MSDSEYYSGGGEKTVAKTVILKKYLWSYLSIMGKKENWSGPKWYVDTHAGTGFTTEMGVNIPGSALRALNYDFDRYYFYEKNPDHFETLVETLNSETDATLSIRTVPNRSEAMACCDEPYIRIMNMDCNEGVKLLTRESPPNSHWFTFVDPEKFSVEYELMECLCQRENMDILFNFQTTAFFRNTGENASHSHEKVESNLGSEFPTDATPDELVTYYKENVFKDLGWHSASRKMISEGSNEWRYDLIFSSQNGTAMSIMSDIFNGNLKDDVKDEIQDWREKTDVDQTGFETFLRVESHEDGDVETADDQSSLGDFS